MTAAATRMGIETALAARGRREGLLIGGAAALLLLLGFVSTVAGAALDGPGHALRALLAPLLPAAWTRDVAPVDTAILLGLRLPRTAMAVAAGGGLALAGVALQAITRNPLVSPYTLGISSAAGFGASLAILFGLGAAGAAELWVIAAAFAMAMLCALLVLALAASRALSPIMLILAGVGLNFLFDAMTTNVQFLASETQLANVVHWSFGSLNGIGWPAATATAAALILGFALLLPLATALNAFAAGSDDVTASLGFAVGRTRLLVTTAAVLMTAVAVSFAGKIGFIGLVAPHVARLLIGADHRLLLPFGALVGAILLLAADLIGRLAFAPVVVPVGIVVAYIGVPIFLHLLLTRRRDLA